MAIGAENDFLDNYETEFKRNLNSTDGNCNSRPAIGTDPIMSGYAKKQ